MDSGRTPGVGNDGRGEDTQDAGDSRDKDAVYRTYEGEKNQDIDVEKRFFGGRTCEMGGTTLARERRQEESAHGQVTETLGRSYKRGYHGDEGYHEDVERERPKRRRGRLGRTQDRKGTQKPRRRKTSGSNYSEEDALGLAKACIIVSGRQIYMEDNMWAQIWDICKKRFGMCRTKESIRAKCATQKMESNIWRTCCARVDIDTVTGISSDEKRIEMTKEVYAAQKAANTKYDREIKSSPFKHIAAAECLCR